MSNEKEQQLEEEVLTEAEAAEAAAPDETTEAEPATEQAAEENAESLEEQPDETAKLRQELEAEQNKYLRLLADFDNYKRRAVKDRQDAEKFRAQSLLTDLLPVLDNFDRALAVETTTEESASILKGLEMVRDSLLDAVKREGLEEVKAIGEQFDPNFHQAVMQESDDSQESGAVLKELQKGYTLKGRVLRPAMVSVNE